MYMYIYPMMIHMSLTGYHCLWPRWTALSLCLCWVILINISVMCINTASMHSPCTQVCTPQLIANTCALPVPDYAVEFFPPMFIVQLQIRYTDVALRSVIPGCFHQIGKAALPTITPQSLNTSTSLI